MNFSKKESYASKKRFFMYEITYYKDIKVEMFILLTYTVHLSSLKSKTFNALLK